MERLNLRRARGHIPNGEPTVFRSGRRERGSNDEDTGRPERLCRTLRGHLPADGALRVAAHRGSDQQHQPADRCRE